MSGTCRELKRDGTPCTLPSNGSNGLCWAHDPKNAEKRRRGQSRGGRSKPSRELQEIKNLISDLTNRVLGGEHVDPLETGRAAVANQLLNTRLRAIEVERKAKETEELEERLEALERAAAGRNGGKRWGARGRD